MTSISSEERTLTGRAPVIFAPFICEPTITISSTSSSANKAVVGNKRAKETKRLNFFIIYPQKFKNSPFSIDKFMSFVIKSSYMR